MIATAIPHSAFGKPECAGHLDIVGRPGFIVDFVCHDCGACVVCAREEDMGAALHILNFAARITSVHCLNCGFANRMAGLDAVYAFVCQNCRQSFDLVAKRQLPRKTNGTSS